MLWGSEGAKVAVLVLINCELILSLVWALQGYSGQWDREALWGALTCLLPTLQEIDWWGAAVRL